MTPADVWDGDTGRISEFLAFLDWTPSGRPETSVHHQLRRHARTWVGAHLPPRMTRGPRTFCFDNSWATARRSTHLHYCEGWAASGDLGFDLPIDHAWLVDDRTGRVIDRTWNITARPSLYVGLAIPADQVRAARTVSTQSTSIIFGDWCRRGWFLEHALADAIELTASLPTGVDG